MVKIGKWCLLTAFVFSAHVLATETTDQPIDQIKRASYQLTASGDIVIGNDGKVLEFRLKSDQIAPAIAAVLDKGIRKWRFEPVLIDGKAVNAKTSMRLDILAEPYGSEYRLRVSHVSFGAPSLRKKYLKPPEYPSAARLGKVQARVLLLLRLNADGRVTDVYPQQTSLSGQARDKVMQEWREIFEESAKITAKRWRFSMEESADGKPVTQVVVRIPVEYRFGDASHWMAMFPVEGSKKVPDWVRALSTPQIPTKLKEGEIQSLTSNFKLKEQVVGTYL